MGSDEGEKDSLRRCSSEGSLSCRSTSKSSNTSRRIYTWLPSTDGASTEDATETMSQSSLASRSRNQMWWRASSDGSAWDAMETMSQVSFASCDSSSQLSSANAWPALHAHRETLDLVDARVFKDASVVTDAPLPTCSHLVKALHEETGMAVELLQELESEGILEQIPRNEREEITSIGSEKHSLGSCLPCIFWFRGICTKSLQCGFCHFQHPGQKGKRLKPNKRTRQLIREMRMNTEKEGARDGQSEEET